MKMTTGKRLYKRCLAANRLGRLSRHGETRTNERRIRARDTLGRKASTPDLPACVAQAYERGARKPTRGPWPNMYGE